MNKLSLILFLCLCCLCQATELYQPTWSPAVYFGQLVDGRTLSSLSPAFASFSFSEQKEIPEGKIPDQIDVWDAPYCTFQTTASTFVTVADYQQAQESSLKLEFSNLAKSFVGTASASFAHTSQMMSTYSSAVSIATSTCKLWAGRILRSRTDLLLRRELQRAILSLPNQSWSNDLIPAYFTFLRDFGGLVRIGAEIGGEIFQKSFTSLTYVGQSGTARTSAQANIQFRVALSGETRSTEEQDEKYLAETQTETLLIHGGEFVPNENVMDALLGWSKSIGKTAPAVAVTETLTPLAGFLESRYFDMDHDAKALDQIRQNLDIAFDLYSQPECSWNPDWEDRSHAVYLSLTVFPISAKTGWGQAQPPLLAHQVKERVFPLLPGGQIAPDWYEGSLEVTAACTSGGCSQSGVFAYVVPNLFRPICRRTPAGEVYVEVHQGDGRGPWMNWPPLCGKEKRKPCVGCLMFGNVEHGGYCLFQNETMKPLVSKADPCIASVDLRIPLTMLVGYHNYMNEAWWISSDVHIKFSCSRDPLSSIEM